MAARRNWLQLGAAVLLLGRGAAWAGKPAALDLPDLQLLDGSMLPRAAWTQRPTVVVFFSADCVYCRRHNARLQKLHESAGDTLRVLGAMLEADAAAARLHVRDSGYSFAVTLDDGRLRRLFTTREVVPMTCLVDRFAHLLLAIPGEMSAADVTGLPRDFDRYAAKG